MTVKSRNLKKDKPKNWDYYLEIIIKIGNFLVVLDKLLNG